MGDHRTQTNIFLVAVMAVAWSGLPVAAGSAAEEPEATIPADGLLISVVDSESGTPVPEFRALAGVKSGSVSQEFEKRAGHEIVNWQPHTIRAGQEGRLVWPLEKAYDVMALRVEADGFLPATSAWIRKSEGPDRVVVRLRQDPKLRGRILQPDGKPAAQATIAVALPQKNALVENGTLHGAGKPPPESLSDRWRFPATYEADDVGEFRIPTETDPGAAVLILHESGVAEMPFDKFRNLRTITLGAWGHIEGRVLWYDKPGADEEVGLTIHRDDYGYPGTISQSGTAKTGADGKFVFTRVLPGHAQVSRWITVGAPGDQQTTSWALPGLFTHVTVRPGDPTRILIGGHGRQVTGRLTGRDEWGDVTLQCQATGPRMRGFRGDRSWQAFQQFRSSPLGPLYFREKLRPNADGTFEIPHVLPGEYQLIASEADGKSFGAARGFRIDPEIPDEEPAPLNLGEIDLTAKQ